MTGHSPRPYRLSDLHCNPITGKVTPVSTLRDALASAPRSDAGGDGPSADGAVYGTYLYMELMHNFNVIFNTDMEPSEVVERAAFVLGFLGNWETSLRKVMVREW